MQAIHTRYAGPTDTKGGRVIAKCDAKTKIVPWDHALGIEDNHEAAARILAESLGWIPPHYTRLVAGSMPGASGGYVHVFMPK